MKKISSLIFCTILACTFTGCGPTLCDCVEDIPTNAIKSIENWVEGEKLDLTKASKLTKACQEKFGDMKTKELMEAYKSCNE